MSVQPQRPDFGTVLASHMAVAQYQDGQWGEHQIKPVGPIEISPAAHVLHYASTCFEGFKAFRWKDGSVHVFRMDRHIARMLNSARQLVLPEPEEPPGSPVLLLHPAKASVAANVADTRATVRRSLKILT